MSEEGVLKTALEQVQATNDVLGHHVAVTEKLLARLIAHGHVLRGLSFILLHNDPKGRSEILKAMQEQVDQNNGDPTYAQAMEEVRSIIGE